MTTAIYAVHWADENLLREATAEPGCIEQIVATGPDPACPSCRRLAPLVARMAALQAADEPTERGA